MLTSSNADDAAASMARKTAEPLCVDLDGTLIWSDLLVESALALVAKRPAMIFAMLAWLLRGKAHLKQKMAQHIELDVATLPYNQALIAWLITDHTNAAVPSPRQASRPVITREWSSMLPAIATGEPSASV